MKITKLENGEYIFDGEGNTLIFGREGGGLRFEGFDYSRVTVSNFYFRSEDGMRSAIKRGVKNMFRFTPTYDNIEKRFPHVHSFIYFLFFGFKKR